LYCKANHIFVIRMITTEQCNKTGNVRISQYQGAFAKLFLPWKSNKCYTFLCVSAPDVGACVHSHFCVCAGMPGSVGVCMFVRAYSLAYPACNMRAPCFIVICGPSGFTSFFDITSKIPRSSEKITEHKMCLDFLCKLRLKSFLFYERFSYIFS
jgi:hypothetical protein